MATTIQRRRVKFETFDEVPREADWLLSAGYEQAGTWDLTQVCNHLAGAMTLSMGKGVRPMVAFPVRWYLKWRYFDKVMQSGRLPSGVKAPPEVRSPEAGDAALAVERLRTAVGQLQAHAGEFSPHPYFGRLSRDEAHRFHLIHCAHHFGFLVPRA